MQVVERNHPEVRL